ncbi:MAG: Hsp20/alpha crystallin family protein [Patescibacteria group bacterium]|nr:Hsp20/alpha crystallin family protein [Patescibacteria group bacterium]MCX7589794.1 Hsp20/alpha crystallin family protein [Patescibacteria group bacterium]MDW8279846.1 Hsp20/alpha crystallin family protein [bacterium]
MKIIKHNDSLKSGRDLLNWFFDDNFLSTDELFTSIFPWKGTFPKVDISETDENIKVIANIPGVDPDKIEIEVNEDTLTIAGQVEKQEEEEGEKFYRFERGYGEFRRQFSLPARINPEKVNAKVKNGVLTIILPKSEKELKKKIKVEQE